VEQEFEDGGDAKQFCVGRAEEVRNAVHRASTVDKNIAIAQQLPSKGSKLLLRVKGTITGCSKFTI
jgi:hypothetical protein